jgi:thioredoxin 1
MTNETTATTQFASHYAPSEPTRETVDTLEGATLVEFGAPWCGFCQAAQAPLAAAMQAHPGVRHLKIEDGKGRALGRSYQVKLWPTLVFLRDGREVARLVRPNEAAPIGDALAQIRV